MHESATVSVYCNFVKAYERVLIVVDCGSKATTVVVGKVVYSGGAAVVHILSFTTGAFTKILDSGGSDLSSLTA